MLVNTASINAQSAAEWASGPAVSRVTEIGAMPCLGTRPTVGRKPVTPQSAAGTRTEPPVSVPMAAGTSRPPTAAPEPPLLPPGILARSQGFRIEPVTALLVVIPNASSCIPTLPAITAPADLSLVTSSASSFGCFPARDAVPAPQPSPTASMLSLSAIGIPKRGSRSPAAIRPSATRASRRSASGSKETQTLRLARDWVRAIHSSARSMLVMVRASKSVRISEIGRSNACMMSYGLIR